MGTGPRLHDATMILGVHTSRPSGPGSSGRAPIQQVKYETEKWDGLGKIGDISQCSGEGSSAEGSCMTYNAVSNLHLHGIKTFPLSVLMYSSYINASLGLSQLWTLVLESANN